MDFYERVIALCKEKGVSRSKMADEIGISRSTPKDWADKKSTPQFATVKKIAEYFGVPITYLTDGQGFDIHTVHDNHGIIGNTMAPVTIANVDPVLTKQEMELLHIFRDLGVMEQAKLLVYAENLKTGMNL